MTTETLSRDVAWEPSGHLSEVALTAAADGEETLLDTNMRAHLDACDDCAVRLGELALRAADVGAALASLPGLAPAEVADRAPVIELAPSIEPAPVIVPSKVTAPSSLRGSQGKAPLAAREKRKVPIAAVVVGLALAIVSAAPSLGGLVAEASQATSVLVKVMPSLVRLVPQAAARAWHGSLGVGAVAVWCLSVALVAAGFGIARRASKRLVTDGGRQ
ncbi:MAG: hypothetical protein R3F14_43980 [Polyangiaceae bacterium]